MRKCKETEPKELQLIGWESQAVVQFTLFVHDSRSFAFLAFPSIDKIFIRTLQRRSNGKGRHIKIIFGHMAITIYTFYISLCLLKEAHQRNEEQSTFILNGSRR
ncbi:hypothetical protein ACKWTF_008178 [Chironomus riparius]